MKNKWAYFLSGMGTLCVVMAGLHMAELIGSPAVMLSSGALCFALAIWVNRL